MFLKAYATPAGVPAAYERGLADVDHVRGAAWPGTAMGDMGQTIDDLLASLPDIIKSGGDAATAIYKAVNAPAPVQYQSVFGAAAPGTIFGLSATTVLLLGGGLLFFLSRR